MKIPKESRIIIFTDPTHANKIVRFYREKDIVIAFSVEGKIALEKKGILCSFPDDLIALPDFNQIGINNFERVKKICLFLDERLKKRIVFLRENKIDIFTASFFWMKVFFDSLITSYMVLERLFNEIKDNEVILFKESYHFDRVFGGQDNLIPPLIENVFLEKHKNIKIVHANSSFFSIEKNLRSALSHVKRFLPHLRFTRSNFKTNGIVLDNRFDVSSVICDILKDIKFYKILTNDYFTGFNCINACDVKLKKTPAGKREYDELIVKFFQEVMDEPLYLDLFDGNRALFNFWNKCHAERLLKSIGYLLSSGNLIKEMLINLAPEILITASCRGALNDAFFLEMARSLKIPIIAYQEGGGFGYLDAPLLVPDINQSDYFLGYGKGVKECQFFEQKDNIIPVGSIYLTNLKLKIKSEVFSRQKHIYVVLDALKTTPYQHYPYNGGFFSQAYKYQIMIINLLKQFNNISFVLKTTKKNELLYNSLVDGKFIKIETKSLSKVLHDATGFILESPSTVLQECLVTNKPIGLLYNENAVKFAPEALKSLSQRVRISSNHEGFHEVIRLIINDIKNGSKMTEDNEFRDRYCLMDNVEENLGIFFQRLQKNSEN